MMYDDYVEKDSRGMVRVPLLKMDEKAVKELIEFIYLHSGQNFGFRYKNSEVFGEYGKMARVSKKKEAGKNWSWADVEIILKNPLEDTESLAELTGRSFMSIRMKEAEVNLLFDRWVSENEALCEGLTREQQVDLYRDNGYVNMSGDVL